VRVLACLLLQADPPEQLVRLRLRLLARHLSDAPRRQRQIVDHLQVREKVELLEDNPDPLADLRGLDPERGDLPSIEVDPPAVDRLEQVDAAKQGALAAPAGTDHDEHLAGVDG
jgi:hypothetical protein